MGRIRFFGVGAADRKVCPTANFVVRYTKKETNAEMKEGQQEARERSASNYGCNEWCSSCLSLQLSQVPRGCGAEAGQPSEPPARMHEYVA